MAINGRQFVQKKSPDEIAIAKLRDQADAEAEAMRDRFQATKPGDALKVALEIQREREADV